MLFKTAYDTTIGSGLDLSKTKQSIKQSFIRDFVFQQNLNLIASIKYIPVFITGRNVSENEIPLFAHPLHVSDVKNNDYLVSDVRSLVRFDNNGEMKIRNNTEFKFIENRMISNLSWLIDGTDKIKNNLSFANLIYAIWITESVSRKFALDPRDQISLTIIAYCYYNMLFNEDITLQENTILNLSNKIATNLRVPINLVLEVLDNIKNNGNFGDINDFCVMVKTVLNNVRLKDFNAGLLITAVGNTWFGLNSKEILAVALEHPPTWVTIVKTALEERTYKNSIIAKIAERYGKNNKANDFLMSFRTVLNEFSISEEELKFSDFE